ncbi:hypothetical protein ACJMK2_010054 [Sinanodonta woodiana]|uniref:Fibrinogen C-terminal domain-containing protein n=1 Tax=Sinanodonta woodiana TaxID=1069815 RepID=A0ABD3VE48_SINWO
MGNVLKEIVTIVCIFPILESAKRHISSTKCKYTFVVNELDSSSCPNALSPLQADKDTNSNLESLSSQRIIPFPTGTNGQSTQELVTWLNSMEKQLVQEVRKSHIINTTLAKHDSELERAEIILDEYRSNFTSVFKMLRYLEQKITRQHEVSRNLDNKLSNIMLDVAEVNNVLSKKVPTKNGLLQDKEIKVQNAAKVNACSATTSEAVVFKDCDDVVKRGHKSSGVYYVKTTFAACPIPVWCDMDTPPSGWMVILRRKTADVSFNNLWQEYRDGFGNVVTDFWLGNDNIFLFSNQGHYELRVDLWDFEGNRVYALYKEFYIEGLKEKYRLHVGSFEGSAKDGLEKHNLKQFSTTDNDNDSWPNYNCAREWEAGWWFANCWFSFLTGQYHNSSNAKYRGISWNDWKQEQLARAEMKIRPSRLHINSTENHN